VHPDYAKMVGFTSPASTEGGGEGGNTKLKSQTGKRKSRPNRITIQMREIQPRDSILVPELYLTMKVCTSSAGERGAEFVNPHITVTTGKFTASMDGRIPADNPL
jgi:hypothetical protein